MLHELVEDPHYRSHLGARRMQQVVMIGYSDSNKDAGIAASRWALQQAQAALVETAERSGVDLTFFHGRGGTVSRGGGKIASAILSAPRGSVKGRLRVTEPVIKFLTVRTDEEDKRLEKVKKIRASRVRRSSAPAAEAGAEPAAAVGA